MTQPLTKGRFAACIDQTLLTPGTGMIAAADWIERNADYGFKTLCVAPWLVPLAYQALIGYPTKVCTVVGFPFGFEEMVSKAAEAARLIDLGASEIDMVINTGALIEGDDLYVHREISEVVRIARKVGGDDIVVKAILETAMLDREQISVACELATQAGVDFVKTSTGFAQRGASVEDVVLMRSSSGPDVQVKASGGIRDFAFALDLLAAGADRLGTSAGISLLEEFERRS